MGLRVSASGEQYNANGHYQFQSIVLKEGKTNEIAMYVFQGLRHLPRKYKLETKSEVKQKEPSDSKKFLFK